LPQRLNSFFASNQELRQLSGKVRQLRAFQLHYEQVAPASLLRASHVIQMEQNVLTLAANNSAVAAKLRQMTPELVRQLQLRGCEVTGIQVRVQVTSPPDARAAIPASVSAQGKQQLSELAATLSDSPLKSALQRLAGNKKRGQ
jgi:hypothetical protein